MHFIDLFLGALLVYGVVRGIWNGFFVELASLLSLLIGIWVAIKFSHVLAGFVTSVSSNAQSVKLLAFALTFILVVIGISLLAKFFTTIASFAGLGLFNKLLGGVFGLLKMTLIISISLNLFAKLNQNNLLLAQETTGKSLFYNPIRNTAALFYPTLERWFIEWKQDEATSAP